jgi:hypothetical protein
LCSFSFLFLLFFFCRAGIELHPQSPFCILSSLFIHAKALLLKIVNGIHHVHVSLYIDVRTHPVSSLYLILKVRCSFNKFKNIKKEAELICNLTTERESFIVLVLVPILLFTYVYLCRCLLHSKHRSVSISCF